MDFSGGSKEINKGPKNQGNCECPTQHYWRNRRKTIQIVRTSEEIEKQQDSKDDSGVEC